MTLKEYMRNCMDNSLRKQENKYDFQQENR